MLRSQSQLVSFVTLELLTNGHKFQPHLISSRKKNRKLSLLQLPVKKFSQPLSIPPLWFRHVSEVGVVDGQSTVGLPGLSAPPAEKKKKLDDKKFKLVKSDKPTKSSSTSSNRPTSASTNQRFEELDQKWSDRFNRLEALL